MAEAVSQHAEMPPLNWSDVAMSELPTGTVTLLLADVEGSTRLWEAQPDEMTSAIARLDRTVTNATPTTLSRAPPLCGRIWPCPTFSNASLICSARRTALPKLPACSRRHTASGRVSALSASRSTTPATKRHWQRCETPWEKRLLNLPGPKELPCPLRRRSPTHNVVAANATDRPAGGNAHADRARRRATRQ